VLSMSRMVGGTFGVAVMGALVSAIGKARINDRLPQLPASVRAHIAASIGGGGGGQTAHTSPQIVDTVREAFVSALGTGLQIGAATTLVGAVIAWSLIRRTTPAPAPERAVARESRDEAALEVGIA
jgi:hypothetical protein